MSQQEYDPWGKVRTGGIGQTTLNYTGQRLDGTGLVYYHARYYDPSLARFVSPDSIVPGASPGAGGALGTIGQEQNSLLTVDFHEGALLSGLNGDNALTLQKGYWFQLSGQDRRQRAREPWGPANPQALNRYAYVLDNPLRYTDPTGHARADDCTGGCGSSSNSNGGSGASTSSTAACPCPVPLPPPYTPTPSPYAPYASAEEYWAALTRVLNYIMNLPVGQRPIMPYRDARSFSSGLEGKVQAHHILEKRFLEKWGYNVDDAPAVLLTRGEHQLITNTLRKLLPYGDPSHYTKAEVWAAYKEAYKLYPHWLEAIAKYFK